MLPERRRGRSDIDSRIENGTAHHPDQFALRMRWQLEMQAAQCARFYRESMIILNEFRRDADGAHEIAAISLQKEAPGVAVDLRNKQLYISNIQRSYLHPAILVPA